MWDILINKGILTVSIVLVIIGITLKHRTGTSNELIAAVLTAISIITWSVVGSVIEWSSITLSVFWKYGIKYGVLSAGISVFMWDLFHGTCKACKDSHKELENEEDNV